MKPNQNPTTATTATAAKAATPLQGVALYGGSFDPVHCAHLKVAHAALQQLDLSKVIFVPAAQSPLKTTAAHASDADRIEMLRLATAAEPRFAVDISEIERGGTSYTVDTVHFFRQQLPASQIYWILGADQFELLPQWRQIEEIAAQLTFIVLRRPGYCFAAPPITGLRFEAVDAPLMAHSSSEIRRRVAAGALGLAQLPPSVEAFISSRGLYTQ
jgi:nicotinate-nucleotide adenylyltransferase